MTLLHIFLHFSNFSWFEQYRERKTVCTSTFAEALSSFILLRRRFQTKAEDRSTLLLFQQGFNRD